MFKQNQPFAKGSSINRHSLFASENYPFWKFRIQIFLEFVDRDI